jgi:hypothetical protein
MHQELAEVCGEGRADGRLPRLRADKAEHACHHCIDAQHLSHIHTTILSAHLFCVFSCFCFVLHHQKH